MTDTVSAGKPAVNGIRTAIGISGIIALVIGILILVWPGRTAAGVTLILAIYAIAAGIVYVALGIFSKSLGGWSRVGNIVLGLLFIAAAIVAFLNIGVTTEVLAIFVAVFIGVAWIIEGVVALTTLGDAGSKGWSIFFAIVSILAGIFLVISPLWAAILLWVFVGAALVAFGIIQIVRAFTFGRAR